MTDAPDAMHPDWIERRGIGELKDLQWLLAQNPRSDLCGRAKHAVDSEIRKRATRNAQFMERIGCLPK